MWKELQQKITEKNINGSSVRVEWSSDGENGEGDLTNVSIGGDDVEFFITDDRPEVGSFTLRSSRNLLGFSPQEGGNLHIFSHYMGSIKILHDR